MSDERWPYGTVVRPSNDTGTKAMIVHDGGPGHILMITLADPAHTLGDSYYTFVWEWSVQRDWWTRVEGT